MKKTFVVFVTSMALLGAIATSALADGYKDDHYAERFYYSLAVVANQGDHLKCILVNPLKDKPLFAHFFIYNEYGKVVWETSVNWHEVDPGTVAYEEYEVKKDGHFWCRTKIQKYNPLEDEVWGVSSFTHWSEGTDHNVINSGNVGPIRTAR